MYLVLSRCVEADFEELIEVEYRAFSTAPIHDAVFGPNTKANHARLKASFLKDMSEDASQCWIKLVDKSTGRIVSAALWNIYPSWAPIPQTETKMEWMDNADDRQLAEKLVEDMMERRRRHMYGHAHVFLNLLFTDPAYQRHGAGSIHVKWGCDVADRLLVPAWVESSEDGHHLYEQNGFVDVQAAMERGPTWEMEATVMRREPKTHLDAGRAIVPS